MDDGHFVDELKELNSLIMKMGTLVEKSIHDAFTVLKSRDKELARKIIESDRELDQLELAIDEKCLRLLALYQPVASDLRFITTAMLITTDLERIGDLSLDISERVLELGDQPLIKPLIDLPKMVDLVEKMMRLSLRAFIERNTSGVKDINKYEDQVDNLRDRIYAEIKHLMEKDSRKVAGGLPLVRIAFHLERIADHTTNIVEDVVYMVDATLIKHQPPTRSAGQ